MTKISGWLTAVMLASALAMPASAAQPNKPSGSGGHPPAAKSSGGFTPHQAGQSFQRKSSGGFTPHQTGQSFQRTQRLHGLTQHNTTIRTLRKTGVKTYTGVKTITGVKTNTGVQTSTGVQTNAQLHHRRNGTAGITPQTAQQGRFASSLAAQGKVRGANVAAHRAWRRGQRAGFVGWYGPVFWPYAYSDIFDYSFWPYGYDDGFWDYAYDDFFDGMFWGQGGPPEKYAYAAPAAPRASYAGVQELCTEPGTGITAWPFTDIQRKVGLNDEQKQLLGGVRKAAADAAATFKASCPAKNVFPLTPPGRLQAMTARLQGTLDAVGVVRPSLDKFYNSLSDEQKERFNTLGPKRPATNAEANAALPQDAKACSEAKPGLANLPIEKIDDVVKPTDAQADGLKQLQDATTKAVSILQAACPDETPLTPTGRLEAMEKRLQAMVDSAKTVKPALESFYTSLSNEQKARFDRIGRELAQPSG
jgi:ABC-type transporter MlaC component